jgi:hypothetical protein
MPFKGVDVIDIPELREVIYLNILNRTIQYFKSYLVIDNLCFLTSFSYTDNENRRNSISGKELA